MSIVNADSQTTTYQNQVLAIREYNGYDDSDFFALVPDNEGGFEWIEYGTTRYAGRTHAIVDASEDLKVAYGRWMAAVIAKRNAETELAKSAMPMVGSSVTVIKGRKHAGKKGTITWQGANQFRTYYSNGYNKPEQLNNQRVRIVTANGESFFTDLLNVRVTGQEDADLYEIAAKINLAHIGLEIPFALRSYIK